MLNSKFPVALNKFQVKMKPLETNQRVLIWLGVLRAPDTTNIFMKIFHILTTFIAFSIVLTSLSASVTFFLRYVRIDLEESLYALFQIASFSGLSYIIMFAFVMRNRTNVIFDKLTQIYNECKHRLTCKI